VARDTSKPGRERNDGKECWVLQSHPDAAKELLKGKNNLNEIREMAKDVLVHDFLESIPYLLADNNENNNNIDVPPIIASIPTQEFTEMESQVITSKNFAACGDYFGKFSGKIEGAYLSGRSAANEIIELNEELFR
jgi:predicted NAD/FAD-dependent oxidoreductase